MLVCVGVVGAACSMHGNKIGKSEGKKPLEERKRRR